MLHYIAHGDWRVYKLILVVHFSTFFTFVQLILHFFLTPPLQQGSIHFTISMDI